MSYSRKVYVKAASTLERRRSKAEHTQSMHREEAYAKIPELISIDREISSAGAMSCGQTAVHIQTMTSALFLSTDTLDKPLEGYATHRKTLLPGDAGRNPKPGRTVLSYHIR